MARCWLPSCASSPKASQAHVNEFSPLRGQGRYQRMSLLSLENVTHFFGGLAAVKNLGFTVESGAIRGLIGPNGSGKSTVFNIIAGSLQLSSGRVRFESHDITNRGTPSLVTLGIARTFQATQIFDDLTI